MAKQRKQIWLATLGDGLIELNHDTSRNIIAMFEGRLATLQKKHGLNQYRVSVHECARGLHAHILFLGNKNIISQLQHSSAFGQFLDVRSVYDLDGLARRYLVKERTPQAQYAVGHMLHGSRSAGSHKLPGGGDRVRLSEMLRYDATAAGYVQPWKKTNAKRCAERKPYRRRPIVKWKALQPTGQLELFPEIADQPTRLKNFNAGTLSPSVALELEFHRRQCGLSQRELGKLAGLSQPQIANVVHGRFGLSRSATNRLKEALEQVAA